MKYLKSFRSYNENILGNLFNKLFKKSTVRDTTPTYNYSFNKDKYNISDKQILEIKDMFIDISDDYDIEYDSRKFLTFYSNSENFENLKYLIERVGDTLTLLKFSIIAPIDYVMVNNENFIKDIGKFKERVSDAGYKCDTNRISSANFLRFHYLYFYIQVDDLKNI